jgi:hypothetical protein
MLDDFDQKLGQLNWLNSSSGDRRGVCDEF